MLKRIGFMPWGLDTDGLKLGSFTIGFGGKEEGGYDRAKYGAQTS